MGKAGYLPDISGRFNSWTATAIKCLSMKNYNGAIGGLDNMNALLDEEHRISISTDDYNEKIHSETFYQCHFCTESITSIINKGGEEERNETIKRPSEIKYADIHIYKRSNDFLETIVLSKKVTRVWCCPKCGGMNKLANTNIIKMERDDPSYIRVVPTQPIYSSENSIRFDIISRNYFNMYSKELENAMMNYRKDYIGEHGEDMADNPFTDKGDKSFQ